MSKRNIKKLRLLILLLIVFLVSLMLYKISVLLVNSGVSAVKTSIETEHVVVPEEETEVNLLGETEIPLYDGAESKELERVSDEKYDILFNQICMLLDNNIFDSIGDIGYDYSNIKIFGSIKNSVLGFNSDTFLKDYTSFFIENSLSIIGLYANRYVITCYNNSNEIIVIDFNGIDVYQEQEYIYSLGDTISIKGCLGQYLIRELSGFDVMFLKG